MYSKTSKVEGYKIFRLEKPLNATGQDFLAKSSELFVLQGRLRPQLDLTSGWFGEAEGQLQIFPEIARTNLFISALSTKNETEDIFAENTSRRFNLHFESKLLTRIGYGENMTIFCAQNGSKETNLKQEKSFELQSELYFSLPNGHSGNLTSVGKGNILPGFSVVTNKVRFSGFKNGEIWRSMNYTSASVLILDSWFGGNDTILNHYESNAVVTKEDSTPALDYSYAATFAQRVGEFQIGRVVWNLETWRGNRNWKSNVDVSLRYVLDRGPVHFLNDVHSSQYIDHCGTRKGIFLSEYLKEDSEITKNVTTNFWYAQLLCGEGVCQRGNGTNANVPNPCGKPMKAHLVAKGNGGYQQREGELFNFEALWENGGKCYSGEEEMPVCSKATIFMLPPEWYQTKEGEITQGPFGNDQKRKLDYPIQRTTRNDVVMVPLTVIWAYVA